MGIKTEEQIKLENDIFSLYLECLDKPHAETEHERGRLWNKLTLWNKTYNTNTKSRKKEMNAEIYSVIHNFLYVSEKKVPKEVNDFISYFGKSLYTKEVEFIREESSTQIPRELYKSLKNLKNALKVIEKEQDRKPTIEEENNLISVYFESRHDYDRMTKLKFVDNLDVFNSEDNENYNRMDLSETVNVFTNKKSEDEPLDELNYKNNIIQFVNAVESFFEKKQERTHDYLKALLTGLCIENDFLPEELKPYLDEDVLKKYDQTRKKPFYSELYLIYRPENTQESAYAKASEYLAEIIDGMKYILKQKGIDFNPENS